MKRRPIRRPNAVSAASPLSTVTASSAVSQASSPLVASATASPVPSSTVAGQRPERPAKTKNYETNPGRGRRNQKLPNELPENERSRPTRKEFCRAARCSLSSSSRIYCKERLEGDPNRGRRPPELKVPSPPAGQAVAG